MNLTPEISKSINKVSTIVFEQQIEAMRREKKRKEKALLKAFEPVLKAIDRLCEPVRKMREKVVDG